jgi:para-nitrobenzyl esterase
MERAQHLFHRVYAISGATADVSEARARRLAGEIAREAGVPPTREGFATVPEERILELQAKATEFGPDSLATIVEEGLHLGPVVDGDVVKRPTRQSLRMGIGADKPLVLGATDDEFTMTFADAERKLRWVPRPLLLRNLGLPKAARKRYLRDNADVVALGKARLAGRILTDMMFRVTVPRTAVDRGEAPTWTYRFSWPSGRFGYAEHCLDVPFFFDCLDGPAMEPLAGPNPPQPLADEIHGAAVRFVVDGDPGWPRYDAETRMSRVYDVPTRDAPDAYESVKSLP